MTELILQQYPGYPTRSIEEVLDAEERIERCQLQRAQEMRQLAEEMEQRAWARLTEIIDARARLTGGEVNARSEQ